VASGDVPDACCLSEAGLLVLVSVCLSVCLSACLSLALRFFLSYHLLLVNARQCQCRRCHCVKMQSTCNCGGIITSSIQAFVEEKKEKEAEAGCGRKEDKRTEHVICTRHRDINSARCQLAYLSR